jgi:hypothetical protein
VPYQILLIAEIFLEGDIRKGIKGKKGTFTRYVDFFLISKVNFCIYSAGVCPFHLVASFKFGNHKSNATSVERRGIKITEVQ